jgi:hypothetical protein
MFITTQILNDDECGLLQSIVGQRWVDISGDGLVEPNLCIGGARIETSDVAIQLSLDMELLPIDGEPDDYPHLHVTKAKEKSKEAINNGNVYVHCHGELVQEVCLYRIQTIGIHNGVQVIDNTADIAVAIKLESMWISFVRASQFSEVFRIRRTTARDQIKLPDTAHEWGPDLLEQYECSGEWIRVGGA